MKLQKYIVLSLMLLLPQHLHAQSSSPLPAESLATIHVGTGAGYNYGVIVQRKIDNLDRVPSGGHLFSYIRGTQEIFQAAVEPPEISGQRWTNGENGVVTGVADDGSICGYSYSYTTELGRLSSFYGKGSTSYASMHMPTAISGSGEYVASVCWVQSEGYYACRHRQGQTEAGEINIQSAFYPVLPYGTVSDINNNGLLVGWDYANKFMFYDAPATAPVIQNWVGNTSIKPYAVNDDGLIVGEVGEGETFYLDTAAQTPTVENIPFAGSHVVVYDVNNSGVIVGSSYLGSGSALPLVGTKSGLVDLTPALVSGSAWTITSALALNDHNHILAWGGRQNGNRYDRVGEVILKPYPLSDRLRRMKVTAETEEQVDEIAVWRPENGVWYVRQPFSESVSMVQWGLSGDVPLRGDFDGDKTSELVIWRPSEGNWYIRHADSSYRVVQWGLPGDVPMEGDFDGDGINDYAVWRPSEGNWYIRFADNSYRVEQWGLPGDVPLSLDYDNDGMTDFAVWRPGNGTWYIKVHKEGEEASTYSYQWGLSGDRPIPGDFDGDDKVDLAVWRPESGNWYFCPSRTSYDCHNKNTVVQFGLPGDLPLASDLESDGLADIAVYRPSSGQWYQRSVNGVGLEVYEQWGLSGDMPLMINVRDRM
ncbi:MAG: FG-GAP-like repeat-containing protein [bacterium]|nr:FG-GAP-like repeat-containing protein [bacterium]